MYSDDTTIIVDTCSLDWINFLPAIPLCDQVFIAGGAATWLSERAIFGTDPDWTPTDIDIFICAREDMFTTIVQALMQQHIHFWGGAQVAANLRQFSTAICDGPRVRADSRRMMTMPRPQCFQELSKVPVWQRGVAPLRDDGWQFLPLEHESTLYTPNRHKKCLQIHVV